MPFAFNHRQLLVALAAAGTAIALTIGSEAEVTGRPIKSTATLPPTRVMDVLEYEIGVEIGSRAFEATYKKDLKTARASAQSLEANLDRRFLHAAGVKHRLGSVIIRTDPEKDPLRNQVTNGKSGSLGAFKNYWNSKHGEVGKTHDLAVYHVYYPPSGIAYVNSVGSGNRYALSCGRGATSWADGTIAHEFGHSWNLHHNNSSGFFYEARPRNDKGADSAGGRNYHVSIMHGGGNHNIGRLATEEADRVYQTRQAKRRSGDLVRDPGPIRPFGSRDLAATDGKPVTIDVIGNDYDCNNDILDAQLLDTISFEGGSIALSTGTGPGGRNELVYTPPTGFVGRDFFHYTVYDTTGRKDWGAVYVTCDGPRIVDSSRTKFDYDFGPSNSTVQSEWELISPDTKGEISWTVEPRKSLEAADRGLAGGVNNINRDLVFGPGKATLNHKLANGIWNVVLNMGDRTGAHDKMSVRAEGTEIGSGVDAGPGKFPYVNGEVAVTDGELNLEFSDEGGRDPNWVVTRLSLKRQ